MYRGVGEGGGVGEGWEGQWYTPSACKVPRDKDLYAHGPTDCTADGGLHGVLDAAL